MENIYSVVRTDLMAGTDVGTYLVSLRFFDSDGDPADIENGNVVKLGALITYTDDDGAITGQERELHSATVPAANTPIDEIVLVANPEVMYDERKKNLHEYINVAGSNVRGYRLHKHDIFSVTKEALNVGESVTPAIGYAVELMAGTKLNVVAEATNSSTQIGKLIAIETAGRYTYYVIQVA